MKHTNMKHTQRTIFILIILALFSSMALGCQKKEAKCPFTTVTWKDTLDDIKSLEGDPVETYDSIYDGTTYTFEKEYDGLKGTIKYMFDDAEKLVCLSWMYETDDSGNLKEVYDKLHKEVEDMLGESGFKFKSDKFSNMSTPGDVWYLETGNVSLTAVDTSDVKAVQYTFLHPDVSEEKPE